MTEKMAGILGFASVLVATAFAPYGAAGAPVWAPEGLLRHRERTPPSTIPSFCPTEMPCTLMLVSDMDSTNRIESGSKLKFEGRLIEMTLTSSRPLGDREALPTVTLTPGPEKKIFTQYNEGGRGGEFSDLILWQNRLYTADDRTGILFEFGGNLDSHFLLPRQIFAEGDGESSPKGFKIEWLTNKDGSLYLGSFGKPWITPEGLVKNRAQEWVIKLEPSGRTTRLDWRKNFELMRKTVGAEEPGYLTHEAIRWSSDLKLWVALPRKFSTEPYNEEADEHRGTNLMIFCTSRFSRCFSRRVDLKHHRPELGFSAFSFIPGTGDTAIVALFSEEVGDIQRTYSSVFDIWGRVMLDVTELPTDVKYEGLAFVRAEGVSAPRSFEGIGEVHT